MLTDGRIHPSRLADLLGDAVHAPSVEHYGLNWAGKAAARRDIQRRSSATLKPEFQYPPNNLNNQTPENPPLAQHMFIEGENLEVLRALQKSYLGRVKMIYIDPPYNTGNDSFVYPDNFQQNRHDYEIQSGQRRENGDLTGASLWKKNAKENGHYHSAWLSMMYPRLYLARNLLRDDGVIFISIDDNEAANLKLLCDEIFGERNFVGAIAWESKTKSQNTITAYNKLQPKIEYIWVYTKNSCFRFNLLSSGVKKYPECDEKGEYRLHKLEPMNASGMRGRESMVFPVLGIYPPSGKQWQIGQEKIKQLIERDDLLVLDEWPAIKMRPHDERNEITEPFWGFLSKEIGTAESGKKELNSILEDANHGFETVKPVGLIKRLAFHTTKENDIILDFFAGSATTMQAVMELNLEDGGHRQCICVQLPEKLDEKSEAFKAGFHTIADISRARIAKVIEKLKKENPIQTQSLQCAYFQLTHSHFKEWRDDIESTEQLLQQLDIFQNATHAGENSAMQEQYMLTELLLKYGMGTLGVDIAAQVISIPANDLSGVYTVYRVQTPSGQTMWFYFGTYAPEIKAAIMENKPGEVIMLNACFEGENRDEAIANLQLEMAVHHLSLKLI